MTTKTDTFGKERELTREIAPLVERSVPGIEVLAVELVSPSRFCVYIDHPSGVDLALCERVTYLLDAFRTVYAIDVSSPGPERPLRAPAHFRNAVGKHVQIRTHDSRTRVHGEITGADDQRIVLGTADDALEIPYDAIVRANLMEEGRETP
jgi:ribosome maturation factor RimP